jgi:putative ABC transport system permease protein
MTHLGDLLRALRHRWGSTLLVLIVATVAVAAATVGPTYNAAARTSIVQDTFALAPGPEQGIDTTESGPVKAILTGLQPELVGEATVGLGGDAAEQRLLSAPIDGMNATVSAAGPNPQLTVAWRDGTCAHIRFVTGRCPSQSDEIMISPSMAAANGWKVGTNVASKQLGRLVVTGIYAIPDVNSVYWSLPSTSFFPKEETFGSARTPVSSDAAFTVRSTLEDGPSGLQGTDTVDLQLRLADITAADVDRIATTAQTLVGSESLAEQQASVQTTIPAAVQTIHDSWTTLSTPILVITGELLVLTWLLLFLVVVDAVEARGAEVALARLRGYGRWRSVWVAVAEPVTVLAVSLPLGALIGWGIATAMGHNLRPGTPMPLGWAGWIGAALATVGALAAVLTAARRVLRRPVVEQWRRTASGATARGWVVDAILLTAAAGGLVQLAAGGTFATAGTGQGSHSSVILLVPALIGVAVAVVASRLLPLACRALFGLTRRRGGLAGFLATRQVARRPGGTRTVMVLVTAFALATFATGTWSVGRDNRHRVADVAVGAATVLTVQAPARHDLAAAVDRADPGGQRAAAVLAYYGGTTSLLAVQPRRFARVAAWGAAGAAQPRALTALAPAAPPPIVLDGDAVRVRVAVDSLTQGARLGADVVVPGGDAPTPVALGTLKAGQGTASRTASLVGCPCELADVAVDSTLSGAPLSGSVHITGLDVRRGGVWHAVPGIAQDGHWRSNGKSDSVATAGASLDWSFSTAASTDAVLSVADRPDPLPAVVARALATSDGGPVAPSGLDGRLLPVKVVDVVPSVPGQATTGVVVDYTYAERAALHDDAGAFQQVWIAPGAAADVTKRLTAQGVHVVSTSRSSTAASQFSRQGPGLAATLFLLDAAAAALLAGLGAVVSLAVSARRRRYEYAALAAGGVSRRVLRRSLVIEQLLVLGVGAVVGIAAGVVATLVSVRSVPEFVTRPTAPPLRYLPSGGVTAVVFVAALVGLLGTALVASRALVRSVRPSLLREPPT